MYYISFLIAIFSSVSECRQIQDSRGDQTLPPDTVQEIQKYIKRLSKDEVRW